MYQASAWLVRQSEGFAHSVVVLKEARNIKYADFVTPGKELVVSAEILKQDDFADDAESPGLDRRQRGGQRATWCWSDLIWPTDIPNAETPIRIFATSCVQC